MKHLFVNYEQALTLEDFGFNEPCICVYLPTGLLESNMKYGIDGTSTNLNKYEDHTMLPAPLLSQSVKFLLTEINKCSFLVLQYEVYADGTGEIQIQILDDEEDEHVTIDFINETHLVDELLKVLLKLDNFLRERRDLILKPDETLQKFRSVYDGKLSEEDLQKIDSEPLYGEIYTRLETASKGMTISSTFKKFLIELGLLESDKPLEYNITDKGLEYLKIKEELKNRLDVQQ